MGATTDGGDTLDVPLPALLGLDSEYPFVGRRDVWDALTQTWEKAASGGRRVVLLGGEAGSGKTRLVTELSRWVHEEGGAVLYGTCSEQPTVPYEPFTMAITQLVDGLDPDSRSWLLQDRRDELARLVPRLAAPPADRRPGNGAGAGEDARSSDPAAERFRLFSAVVDLLATMANRRPVLLVLDDLHSARRPTMELLGHVVRSPGSAPLFVIGTYRSTVGEVGDDFKAALPELRRQPGVSRLSVDRFGRDEIRRFVTAAAGHDLVPGLEPAVDVLEDETGGNAFLLGELWRHLVEAGDLVQVAGRWVVGRPLREISSPEGVREVVAARLARLPESTRGLVRIAAVAGVRFPLTVLAAAADLDVENTLAVLEPAVRAHIVEEVGPGEHRFVHALVRRAVVEGLGAGERRIIHRDVACALEAIAGDYAIAAIAHHTLAAVPIVDADRAVDVGVRAAEAAKHAVAYDDAARMLEGVLPLVGPSRERCELLLELADSRMRAGDVANAQERCLEATGLARSLKLDDLVVLAALVFDDANWRAALDGNQAEKLLRYALPLTDDPATAIRVQAGLSRALAFSERGEEAEAIAEDTIAAALDLGDPEVMQVAYGAAVFTRFTPANLTRISRYARELAELSEAQGNPEWELGAVNKLMFSVITFGHMDEARKISQRHHMLTGRVRQPLFEVLDRQSRALIAMGEGRFVEAEKLAEEADSLAGFLSGNDGAGAYGVQIFSIRREQGRLDESRPLVEAVARFDQAGATWRPALAVLYAELGLAEDAAREVELLVADGLVAVPRDSLWWASLSFLADACTILEDRTAAAVVYPELLAGQGLVVQVGNLLAAYGSADRYLGSLAALLGQDHDAERHFEKALDVDTRSRMPVWLTRTNLAYGRFLVPRDPARAATLLGDANAKAVDLGMARVAADAAALLDRLGVGVASAEPAPPASSEPAATTTTGPAPMGLTVREVAILGLLVDGLTNREIGERLHISQHTAANHVRSILMKTGCVNRTEAAAWALRHGLQIGP